MYNNNEKTPEQLVAYQICPIKQDGTIVINSITPIIKQDWIEQQCNTNKVKINFKPIYGKFGKKDLEGIQTPTIVQIFNMYDSKDDTVNQTYHLVFIDHNKKIYDSYYESYIENEEDRLIERDEYYKNDINDNDFQSNIPQQSAVQGYCSLFVLSIARLKARGECLESMDKKLQAQKMKQELATFTEINSKMHINGVEYRSI